MNCTDILELAPLYLSGEIEPAQAQQFAAHLKACPRCAHEMEQQRAFDSLVRASILVEDVASAAEVEDAVRQTIAAGSRRWLFTVAGIAAVLLLAVFGVRTAFAPRGTPVYAAAARDHRLEIVDGQPRPWLTDPSSIAALAAKQGIEPSYVEALAPTGYRLEKGKLCFLNRQIFLHLVYTSDSANFSVFLRHADGARSIHLETQGAEHVAGFEQHQLTALIVTEQAGDAAERFARSAAAIL